MLPWLGLPSSSFRRALPHPLRSDQTVVRFHWAVPRRLHIFDGQCLADGVPKAHVAPLLAAPRSDPIQ